jgi:hypothetical protein
MYVFGYHSYLITYMISKCHAYTMLPHARRSARFLLVYEHVHVMSLDPRLEETMRGVMGIMGSRKRRTEELLHSLILYWHICHALQREKL